MISASGFRNYYLGNQFTTEQAEMIAAGDFKDLRYGDYWNVDGIYFRICDDTNWYKRRGDTEFTKDALLIMPDENILKADGSTKYMKDTNDTTGAYASTKYRATYRAQAKKKFTDFFGAAHIASYRGLIATAVSNGGSSNWASVDCDVELPTEDMLFGAPHCNNGFYGNGSFYGQLKLFRERPEFIVAKTRNGDREESWEQNVVSASWFAAVGFQGCASAGSASAAIIGCRPFALLI